MSAVLFLVPESMGDALGTNGRTLKKSFEGLGYDFLEVNLAKPDSFAALDQIMKSATVELAYSCVGIGASIEVMTTEGKNANFWDVTGIPFLSLYGDSPAYFFDRHVLPPGPFASLYAFREHYEVRKRLPEIRGLLGVLPPIVEDAVPKAALDFAAKERGKLLFLKNGNDPEQLLLAWRECLSEAIFLMLTDLAAQLASHLATDLCNDIDSLVVSTFAAKGWDIEKMPKLRIFFVAQLDDYCRRLKSKLIAESLLDMPIEVHGYNWEHVDFSKGRATLVPYADWHASRSLIAGSLGVLDMSPNTGKSPHDRVRRSIGSYTLCLTNEQQCLKDRYSNYRDFSFQFEKESIQAKVADVLSHPKRYVELGIEIAETYRKGYDPDTAARYFLDTASMVRLQCSPGMRGLQNYFAWPPKKLS